jgi:PadR family transcriptional regulator PadR
MRYPSEAMKGLTPLFVLQALSEEELGGLALLRRIRELTWNRIDIPDGTIYPLLYRLEAQGALKGRWRSDPGKRRQRVYCLTQEGRSMLATDRAAWTGLVEALSQFLTGKESAT